MRPFLWSGHVSDPGLGSSGASLISTPGSGSGCDSCSGSESGSVGDFGSMLRGVALFVALISGCGTGHVSDLDPGVSGASSIATPGPSSGCGSGSGLEFDLGLVSVFGPVPDLDPGSPCSVSVGSVSDCGRLCFRAWLWPCWFRH